MKATIKDVSVPEAAMILRQGASTLGWYNKFDSQGRTWALQSTSLHLSLVHHNERYFETHAYLPPANTTGAEGGGVPIYYPTVL